MEVRALTYHKTSAPLRELMKKAPKPSKKVHEAPPPGRIPLPRDLKPPEVEYPVLQKNNGMAAPGLRLLGLS